jgi:uncharacterized membrane protein YfcA
MIEALIAYLLLGSFTGVMAGLFGIGGGLLIVPVLATLLPRYGVNPEQVVHLAIGTSLGTIVFTSLSSIRAHHRRGAVLWPLVRVMAPGIMIGAVLGAVVAGQINRDVLRIVFACFEFGVALYLFFSPTPTPRHTEISKPTLIGTGTVIGTVSSLLGIGGGTMTVPFLVWNRVRVQEAVGTAAACGLPIALAGVIGFMLVGLSELGLPDLATGYVYWPALLGITITSILFAPVGAALAHRLPAQKLKKAFALLLVFLGIKMLLS